MQRIYGREFDCRDLMSLPDPMWLHNAPQTIECPSCEGMGVLILAINPVQMQILYADCPDCNGQGWGFWLSNS